LFDGNIQDLDVFVEEMSDEGSDAYRDSIFNRDDDEFSGF